MVFIETPEATRPNAVIWRWDSYSEYHDYCVGVDDIPGHGGWSSHGKEYGTDWASADWDKAVSLSRDGWPEGRERVEERMEKFKLDVSQRVKEVPVPTLTHSVAGAFPDIGAFLQGEPESMITWESLPKSDQIVHLVLNQAASGSISGNAIINKGAALLAFAEFMELHGRRVEITAMDIWLPGHSLGGGVYAESRMPLKRADESLQIDQVAFALAHPAAMRRIGFAFAERLAEPWRSAIGLPSMYGGVADTKWDRGDVYFGAMSSASFGDADIHVNWTYDESASRWLIETLRRSGILEEQ